MITAEEHIKYLTEGAPEELLLPEEYDNVAVWEKYIEEDDRAIFGGGSRDVRMIYYANRILAKGAGVLQYAPPYGKVLDIGAGYNPIGGLINAECQYYPVDILKHTPLTILIEPGKIKFEDGIFDLVTCCNVFQHLHKKERLAYVKEAFRLMAPNSMLFIACTMDIGIVGHDNYKNGGLAITGDYLVPWVNKDELKDWDSVGDDEYGLARYYTGSRMDGFATLWYKKVKNVTK